MEVELHDRMLCVLDGGMYCGFPDGDENAIAHIPELDDATTFGFGGLDNGCLTTAHGSVECLIGQTRTPIAGITHARRVEVRRRQACALLDDGAVTCWGENRIPALVPNVRAEQLALGYAMNCARGRDGSVTCWGDFHAPYVVRNVASATDVAAAGNGACAIVLGGKVACWGTAQRFITPPAPLLSDEEAIAVPGIMDARQLALSDDHACAVLADGKVTCFGEAYDASAMARSETIGAQTLAPTSVFGLPAVVGVATSASTSCAWTRAREIYCWGKIATYDGFDFYPPTLRRFR